jgi:hypothetical protein
MVPTHLGVNFFQQYKILQMLEVQDMLEEKMKENLFFCS